MIRHIVLFKLKDFKDDQDKTVQIDTLISSFSSLKVYIDIICDYDVERNQGQSPAAYDVIINSTFKSWDDLKSYSDNPIHQDCIKKNNYIAKEKAVIDYEF